MENKYKIGDIITCPHYGILLAEVVAIEINRHGTITIKFSEISIDLEKVQSLRISDWIEENYNFDLSTPVDLKTKVIANKKNCNLNTLRVLYG